ncbi:MAG: hypothetical protein U5K00_11630 [Melioribacteraceae bacterium]|nr:hypothetical protein [Melioribacteraceae bacterium]
MISFLFRLTFVWIIFSASVCAQSEDDFHSFDNRLQFSDYLFCEGDYVRAIDEYRFVQSKIRGKSEPSVLKFRIALAFREVGRYGRSQMYFMKLFNTEKFADDSRFEFFRNLYLFGKYEVLEERFEAHFDYKSSYLPFYKKLVQLSKLYSFNTIEDSTKFFEPFSETESFQLLKFYMRKQNLEPKSPVLAAIMSGVIPGLGKLYTENYGDGITALLLTGVLTFLSVDNFKAEHDFRGWLFAGLAAYFYAGNIYGSAASAELYNTNLQISFNSDLELFLKNNNHFVPKSKWLCE